jgi:hypothetical protein
MDDVKRGGPETCPRPCDVCEGGSHHWLEAFPDDDEGAEHPAHAEHGLEAWYGCKHCDAWVEDVEDDDDAFEAL